MSTELCPLCGEGLDILSSVEGAPAVFYCGDCVQVYDRRDLAEFARQAVEAGEL